MKTLAFVLVSFVLIGCGHRENGWDKITEGGPVDQPQSSITVQERPGYLELFFRGNTPPSDLFWYADERFKDKTLILYAQIGPDMFRVTPDKYQIDYAGTRVTFEGWKTLYPDCSSVQIAY